MNGTTDGTDTRIETSGFEGLQYETGDFLGPYPLTFYGSPGCDCGYGGRHSRLRHWYRLRFLKETWQ
jgi:hypothetical protein